MYFLANEHETPVQPIDEEEFTKLQKRRNSFSAAQNTEYLRKTPAHAQQSSAFPKRQLLFTVWPPKKAGSKPVRSQARPRGSEAHRMRRREPSSSTIVKKYNNTGRWRCYKAALLLKKKRDISLTRKHP